MRASVRGAEDDATSSARIALAKMRRFMLRRDHRPAEGLCQTDDFEIQRKDPAQYRRVVDDLRRRYVVGYTSSHIQHDGSWRDVEIRIKDMPAAAIRSAGGYQAPSSK